eukprot:scaffold1822_cov333-Pavlova_lutheri.AAC.2
MHGRGMRWLHLGKEAKLLARASRDAKTLHQRLCNIVRQHLKLGSAIQWPTQAVPFERGHASMQRGTTASRSSQCDPPGIR